MILGRAVQVAMIILFFGFGLGYLANHPKNRSKMEQGKMKLRFQVLRSSCQIRPTNLHSSMRCRAVSSFCLHNMHLEGVRNPIFCNQSFVRIFFMAEQPTKMVAFWNGGEFPDANPRSRFRWDIGSFHNPS